MKQPKRIKVNGHVYVKAEGDPENTRMQNYGQELLGHLDGYVAGLRKAIDQDDLAWDVSFNLQKIENLLKNFDEYRRRRKKELEKEKPEATEPESGGRW